MMDLVHTCKRVSRKVASRFDYIYPLVHAWRANRQIRRDTKQRAASPEIAALSDAGLLLKEAAQLEVAAAFNDEIGRLRRLEDKLTWHFAVVTLLLGVATAVAGVAISQRSVSAMVLIAGSFVSLGSAGLLTLEGSRATELYTPDPVGAIEHGDQDLSRRLTADRLRALSLNPARGWQLNNALFAAQRSLVVAVVLMSVSGLITTVHQLDHNDAPAIQISPSSRSSTRATPAVIPQSGPTFLGEFKDARQ